MGKKDIRLAGLTIVVATILVTFSCTHEKNVLQNPRVILDYSLDRTDSTLVAVENSYQATIDECEKNKEMAKPGVYADYAVSLALDKKFDQADSFFNIEIQNYPESEKLVSFLRDKMTSQAGRERVCQEHISDSIAREEALKNQLGNNFEFEKVSYPKGSKEYKQLQKEKKKAKKEKAKAKKKAKKEKEKAKKALKKQKEQQKEQLKDEREEQKKQLKKQREEQKEQLKKQREEQKEKQANEREAKKKNREQQRNDKKSVLQTVLENDTINRTNDTINR